MAKEKPEVNKEIKVDKNRTYPIDYFLKDSKRPEAIKRMMRDFFKGKSKTLEEWTYADKQINERRC